MRRGSLAWILTVAFACLLSLTAQSAEIRFIGGAGLKAAMDELLPEFERESGHKVIADYGTSGAIAERVRKGEGADVAIVAPEQFEALQKEGRLAAGAPVEIGKNGIGMAVRKDAAKPDIASVEALKRTLRAAKTVGYVDPRSGAPSGIYLAQWLAREGLDKELGAKLVLAGPATPAGSPLLQGVAKGEIEVGFILISEILAAPGVALAGPLPKEIQSINTYVAGTVAGSKSPEADKALIDFIAAPKAQAVLKSKGLQM